MMIDLFCERTEKQKNLMKMLLLQQTKGYDQTYTTFTSIKKYDRRECNHSGWREDVKVPTPSVAGRVDRPPAHRTVKEGSPSTFSSRLVYPTSSGGF